MPINIEKMAADTATITITAGEDSAQIEYSPALVTEDIFSKLLAFYSLQAIAETGNEQDIVGKFTKVFADLNETIVYLVRSWQIYATVEDEKAGKAFPLEVSALVRLPLKIRMAVIRGIMADIRPESLAAQETEVTPKL
jgi:hypothetical protein